jgi:N-acetylglucosamine malate deacetylase 1
MKKVLVIAPHMDDEVLGCGATIAKHVDRGDSVNIMFVAHRVYNHSYDEKKNKIEQSHALKAKKVLGYNDAIFLGLPDERLDVAVQDIIIPMESHLDRVRPDFVYIPFRGDNNQDHRAVFDAARVILRPVVTPYIENIYMYEAPSSTEQSPPLPENVFYPNYYVDISRFMERKLKALRCYETEKRNYPHPRSEDAVKILAQKRGIECGFSCAEVFMIIRSKWE